MNRRRQQGVSLVELMVALGAVSFLILGYTSMNTNSLNGERRNRARIEATMQLSEIANVLVNANPRDPQDTCIRRMGLTGSEAFTPASQFNLPNIAAVAPPTQGVRVDRIYLNNSTRVGNDGTNLIYRSLLTVQQTDISNRMMPLPLTPKVIGVVKVTVDGGQRIVGCSWDTVTVTSTTYCESIEGTVLAPGAGTNCDITADNPTVNGPCPGNTALDMVSNRCVPANVACYRNALGENFDGNLLGCDMLPAAYAVRYPAEYTPPPGPTPTPSPTSAQNTQPIPAPTPSPTPGADTNLPVIQPCDCGGTQMTPGSSALCVKAYSNYEGFGNYDDMFDVNICDTAGNLVPGNPSGYFEEEGIGTQWSWRIAQCASYGGRKTQEGQIYTTGNCY